MFISHHNNLTICVYFSCFQCPVIFLEKKKKLADYEQNILTQETQK